MVGFQFSNRSHMVCFYFFSLFCWQDPNAGIVPRMQEGGSIPSAGPGPTPLTANGYIRNAILKEQIMRRQQVCTNLFFSPHLGETCL